MTDSLAPHELVGRVREAVTRSYRGPEGRQAALYMGSAAAERQKR